MDWQTEKLLEKYWTGETSIAEEKLIKEYFKQNPELSMEGQYFRNTVSEQSIIPAKAYKHPGKKRRLAWISVAAAILIGLMTLPFIFVNETAQEQFAVEDPAEALEITRTSLMMVSNGLNKGKMYSKELNKFNKIKTTIKKQ